MNEADYKGIKVLEGKAFPSDDLKEKHADVLEYIRFWIVVDFDRVKTRPSEIFLVRNDRQGKWWVCTGDLDVTLLFDIDAPEMKDMVLYGPFDDAEIAKNMAILHQTQHAEEEG